MRHLLFLAHTLNWLNYVTVMFLLVSFSDINILIMAYFVLCTVKAKKVNKNIEQRVLPGFITIYRL